VKSLPYALKPVTKVVKNANIPEASFILRPFVRKCFMKHNRKPLKKPQFSSSKKEPWTFCKGSPNQFRSGFRGSYCPHVCLIVCYDLVNDTYFFICDLVIFFLLLLRATRWGPRPWKAVSFHWSCPSLHSCNHSPQWYMKAVTTQGLLVLIFHHSALNSSC